MMKIRRCNVQRAQLSGSAHAKKNRRADLRKGSARSLARVGGRARNFRRIEMCSALGVLLYFTIACDKGDDGSDSSSGGAPSMVGSGGGSTAAPPWLRGSDLSCGGERTEIDTCEWAVSADRIVWGEVVEFELLTSPLFRSTPVLERWDGACSSPIHPYGRLTIAVEENLRGEGDETVAVTLSSGLLSEFQPTPHPGPDGEIVWLPEGSGAGIFPGMKIGLAIHRVEGYADWLGLDEVIFGLYEGQLVTSKPYCVDFPPVLYQGSLAKLRGAVAECEGSNAKPRLLEKSTYAFRYAAAFCQDPQDLDEDDSDAP